MTEKGEMHEHVQMKILDNGMTILVRPIATIPKVSLQIWYNVGSKNEKDGEKGIAHLIEHMVFKGTTGKDSLNLSESDINILMHQLSGNCNAFTSNDYTGYLFNVPKQYWQQILPVMADCMRNCAFKDEHLNSELKTVIQELKMYRDHYSMALVDDILSAIFIDHPYRDPVIGYKHQLWQLHGDDLHDFYQRHYLPNNATLVVVGDVDPKEVFETAEKYFGSIPGNPNYVREIFHYTPDIASKKVVLYRDVQQPFAAEFFVVPGTSQKQDQYLDVITILLGEGKGSRLHRILVDEEQLATSLAAFHMDLFDHALLGIAFEPKQVEDIEKIRAIIEREIVDLANNGFKKGELERAVKNAQVRLYDTFENMQRQAYEIGKYFVATSDPEYLFTYLQKPLSEIGPKVQQILKTYCRPAVMHEGIVLPLPEQERQEWVALQKQFDQEDLAILAQRIRTTPVEGPLYTRNTNAQKDGVFNFPKAKRQVLDNGLTLLYYHNPATPKVNLVMEFKAKHYYEPDDKLGLLTFVNRMLTEGTTNYTAAELADALESRGIRFAAQPGGIMMSMLSVDLEKGLELLHEIVTEATFEPEKIEKVRTQMLADIKSYWDDPGSFSGQLVKDIAYKNHPYSKNILGTPETIKAITREDLVEYYKQFITPQETKLAIVGDIANYSLPKVVEKALGPWQGPIVSEIEFPTLKRLEQHDENYFINRDQVILSFVGHSVKRTDADFDRLLLFDQIFGSGALGSMASRLFQLREETGLFYAINGSVIAHADEQPGMILIKAIVSLDRLAEAQKRIEQLVDTVVGTIQPYELEEAKHAVANALISVFESNSGIAKAFLLLERYKFAPDYFDMRKEKLSPITVADVQGTVKKILRSKLLVDLRIGREQVRA